MPLKSIKQVLPLWVDMEVMAMKVYATLLKAPELEPHPHMQFSVLLQTTPSFFAEDTVSPTDKAVIYLGVNKNQIWLQETTTQKTNMNVHWRVFLKLGYKITLDWLICH